MLDLARIPKGFPVGWAYVPSTAKDYPNCDVEGCKETPKFEIFFGSWVGDAEEIEGVTQYWWYVCKEHRDALRGNEKWEDALPKKKESSEH